MFDKMCLSLIRLYTIKSLNKTPSNKKTGLGKNRNDATSPWTRSRAISALCMDDSDWARTNDLHPVKVALSQLSYGIICRNLSLVLLTSNNIQCIQKEVNMILRFNYFFVNQVQSCVFLRFTLLYRFRNHFMIKWL